MKKHTTLTIAALFMAAALSFGCSDSGTDETTPPPPTPSIGAEGGACTAEGTCNTGLACSAETKVCLKVVVVQTCEGEGVCPDGYECKDNKCVSTGPKAGEEGGACLPESECSGTLICKASVCSKCTADADCGDGKVCSSSGACGVKPCPDGMVLIPGGQFKMGSNSVTINGATTDCSKADNFCSDEYPQHGVTVSSFCMDGREFTNGDKKLSVFAGSSWPQAYGKAEFNTDAQPLIYVSWTEADAICKKQNRRLPTEAEWEYAARGGTKAEYGTADGKLTDTNACWKQSKTCEVKKYGANPFKLYDMSGNVWEWVSDWYKSSYDAGVQADPTGPTTGPSRVLRGGSWSYSDAGALRASGRGYDPLRGPGRRCWFPLCCLARGLQRVT